MDIPSIILSVLAIGLLFYAFIRGENLALEGLKLAGNTIWNNLALLLSGFVIAGLVQVLIPRELIVSWLGNQSGVKGVLIGSLVGGIIPGSPYAVFPVAGGFYQSGAGLGSMISFITAWALWSVSRLPVEMALIDPKVALIRYGITFLVPPAAGLLAQALNNYLF